MAKLLDASPNPASLLRSRHRRRSSGQHPLATAFSPKARRESSGRCPPNGCEATVRPDCWRELRFQRRSAPPSSGGGYVSAAGGASSGLQVSGATQLDELGKKESQEAFQDPWGSSSGRCSNNTTRQRLRNQPLQAMKKNNDRSFTMPFTSHYSSKSTFS